MPDPAWAASHTACLVLARVDGKSREDYLTEPERVTAREIGRQLLADPSRGPLDGWRLLEALG